MLFQCACMIVLPLPLRDMFPTPMAVYSMFVLEVLDQLTS